jgi:hypothetical protein
MPNASRRLSCGLEGSPAMPADLPCRQHATVQSCVNCQEPAVVPRDCFAYASTTTTGLVCGHPVWSVAMTSPLQGPAAVIRPSRDCYVFFLLSKGRQLMWPHSCMVFFMRGGCCVHRVRPCGACSAHPACFRPCCLLACFAWFQMQVLCAASSTLVLLYPLQWFSPAWLQDVLRCI